MRNNCWIEVTKMIIMDAVRESCPSIKLTELVHTIKISKANCQSLISLNFQFIESEMTEGGIKLK